MKWVVRIGGGLLGVLLLAVLFLWIASNRRDAGRMRGSVEIARSPEEIFAWLQQPEKLKQWVSWLSEVRPDPTTPAEGIGHRETWIMDDPRMKKPLPVPGIVTVWEPPFLMGVHIEAPGVFEGDVLYKLTDLGNGRTRFEHDERKKYLDRFSALMEPMITPDAMRQLFDDMNKLRAKLEALPYPSDSSGVAPADSTGR